MTANTKDHTMTDPIHVPVVAVHEDSHGVKYRPINGYAEVSSEIQAQILGDLLVCCLS